jgi:integrase
MPEASRLTGAATTWPMSSWSWPDRVRSPRRAASRTGTLDTYSRMYHNHVRTNIAKREASRLTAVEWQLWLDGLSRSGLKRNSISVTLNCVRSIYRWACAPTRMKLSVNATRGLEFPGRDATPRDRVATPDEVTRLLAVLKEGDRVSYALSLYAGLRNCERLPLEWTDVDFIKGRINLPDSKSEAGIRKLPITPPLQATLREEWMRQGRPSESLVCRGPKGGAPEYNSMVSRTKKAWEDASLEPIGFHECRHSYITHLIHSGLNGKAVQTLAGHGSIQVTFDTYGHVFDGHEREAGRLLASYYRRGTSITDEVEAMSREDLVAVMRALLDTNVSPVSTSVSTTDTKATEATL